MTVLNDTPEAPLSPFFGRAPWIAFVDLATGRRTLTANAQRSTAFVVGHILQIRPQLVICGYVDHESASRILEAGIDLRLGPCSVPASALLKRVYTLPPVATVVDLERRCNERGKGRT